MRGRWLLRIPRISHRCSRFLGMAELNCLEWEEKMGGNVGSKVNIKKVEG
jgi:hypothetical protein